jgi:hypothetical protein
MLRSIVAELPGFESVEIRELDYREAEPLFDLPSDKLGKEIIKASLYRNGSKVFDGPIGLAEATALFTLVDKVLEVNGMGKQKGR